MKVAGLCALVALAATLAGRAEVLAQGQQAPKPAVPVEAPKPPVAAEAPKPKPSAQELKRWRQTMVHAPPPEGTCFVAEYPATAWTNAPCGKPPKNVTHQLGGPGGLPDFQAATRIPVKSAEGSFDSVIGVHSACSAACTNGTCQTCTNLPNNFSLQLNTNIFPTRVSVSCNNNPKWNCQGWEQFVFSNRHCEGNGGQGEACAYIEYWLYGYDPQHNTCPTGYQRAAAPPGLASGCVANSKNAVNLASLEVADLGLMQLAGGAANAYVHNDWVIFTYSTTSYLKKGDNRFTDLGQYWTQTEFNVFGIGNGDRVLFNPGSTLVVRIEVDNGTPNAPTCQLGGYGTSGESNNLNPIVLPTGSTDAPNTGPAQTYSPNSNPNLFGFPQPIPVNTIPNTQQTDIYGGPSSAGGPALVFGESNAPPGPVPDSDACARAVTVGVGSTHR